MGRPSMLTPERHDRICDAIRTGNTQKCAAGLVNVTERALLKWLKRGREERERRKDDAYEPSQNEERYVRLVHEVEAAHAEAEAAAVALVKKGALEDWRAALVWLERRRPNEWGKRDPTIVNNHTHVRMNEKAVRDELRALLMRRPDVRAGLVEQSGNGKAPHVH